MNTWRKVGYCLLVACAAVLPRAWAEEEEIVPSQPAAVPMPDGYYPAEYIESTAHQVIHTDYRFVTGDSFSMTAMLTGTKHFRYSAMFGGKVEDGWFCFRPFWEYNSMACTVNGNDHKWNSTTLPENERLVLTFSNDGLFSICDENGSPVCGSIKCEPPSFSLNDFALFSFNTSTSADGFTPDASGNITGIAMRLYDFTVTHTYFDFKEDEVATITLAHFIPCCRNYDRKTKTGEFGLWEEIGGKFYGDANTIAADTKGFLGGPVTLPKRGLTIIVR